MCAVMDKAAWQRAKQYMLEKARPLERAMFQFEFLDGEAREVVLELSRFQNEDGGFGHGIEPDFRCGASSALATTVALQYLSALPKAECEPLVKKALAYFEGAYSPEKRGWEKVPPEVNEAPHAPWWNYTPDNPHWGNPNAEIAGYFAQFYEWVPRREWTRQLVLQAVDYLNDDSSQDELHELLCYLRMAERVPLAVLADLSESLGVMVKRCVNVKPEAWEGYGLQPVGAAPTPLSPYYERFAGVIPANLDWLQSHQTEEGAWEPSWNWGQGQFEKEWSKAREEWKGVLTLTNLRILRAYGRLTVH